MNIVTISEEKSEYRPGRVWKRGDAVTGPSRIVGETEVLAALPAAQTGQLDCLRGNDPDLAQDVTDILSQMAGQPRLEAIAQRALKAAALVREAQVGPPRDLAEQDSYLHEVARVTDGEATYAVCLLPNSTAFCDCQDWQHGRQLDLLAGYYRAHPNEPHRPADGAPKLANGDFGCAHILAVRLMAARKLRQERSAWLLAWEEAIEREVEEAVYGLDPARNHIPPEARFDLDVVE